MNTHAYTNWAIVVAAGAAPFLGLMAVRTVAGVGGPASASANTTDPQADADHAHDSAGNDPRSKPRAAVVAASEAPELRALSEQQRASWSTALFPPPILEVPEAMPVRAPAGAPTPGPALSTSARFADRFRVSSIMTTGQGMIAVIDRKLRRVGEDVGSGAVVESIDVENRAVVLRLPDGSRLERRASK